MSQMDMLGKEVYHRGETEPHPRPKIPEIPRELGKLREHIEELARVAIEVKIRLSSVLPDAAAKGPTTQEVPTAAYPETPLGRAIRQCDDIIQSVYDEFRVVRSQIQLDNIPQPEEGYPQ